MASFGAFAGLIAVMAKSGSFTVLIARSFIILRRLTMTTCGSFVEYWLVNYDGQFRRVRWIEISNIGFLAVMASSGSFTVLITPNSCLGCCSKSKNLEIMIFKLSYRIYFSTKIKYILTYKRLSRTTSKWIWRMKGRRIYSTKHIYSRTIYLSI